MRRFLFAVLASVAISMGYTAPALADLLFFFTADHCTGGCGSSPFGTVLLHQDGANKVDITVTLNPGEGFVVTGAGDALLFNLNNVGNPSIAGNITITTPGFHLDTSGSPLIHADGTGNWEYGILCDSGTPGCGSGGNNPNPGPLVFNLVITGLTEASFIATAASNNYFFASDICASFTTAGCTGNTGDVAAPGPGIPQHTNSVPEPGSLLLLAAGLLGLGGMRWKRGLSSLRKSA